MKFAFFRPNDLGEAVRIGTASRGVREKNRKFAVLRRSYNYYLFLGKLTVREIITTTALFHKQISRWILARNTRNSMHFQPEELVL